MSLTDMFFTRLKTASCTPERAFLPLTLAIFVPVQGLMPSSNLHTQNTTADHQQSPTLHMSARSWISFSLSLRKIEDHWNNSNFHNQNWSSDFHENLHSSYRLIWDHAVERLLILIEKWNHYGRHINKIVKLKLCEKTLPKMSIH